MIETICLGGVILIGIGWLNYRQIRRNGHRLEHQLKKSLIRRV